MDKKRRKKLEKTLFALLGKAPGSFFVVLDEDGWLPMRELHRIVSQMSGFRFITPAILRQFADVYCPELFEMRENMIRVRPEYLDKALPVPEYVAPPERLYVSVRPKAYTHVVCHGLLPPSGRRWIVLPEEQEHAVMMGKRLDAYPLVGEIDCIKAEGKGVCFFRTDGRFCVVEWLPSDVISLPPLPEGLQRDNIIRQKEGEGGKSLDKGHDKDKLSGHEHAVHRFLPGSFFPDKPPAFLGKSERYRKKCRKQEPSWKERRRKSKK